MKNAACSGAGNAGGLGDGGQEPAVGQPDGHVGQADGGQRLGGGLDQLGLGQDGRLADDVDVALVELPVAALLRPLGPPDRADLQGPERHREAAPGWRRRTGSADGQVVAQAQVDQVAQRGARRDLGRQAALEDLEDELLVVGALARLQAVDVLQRRGLDPLVAEAA